MPPQVAYGKKDSVLLQLPDDELEELLDNTVDADCAEEIQNRKIMCLHWAAEVPESFVVCCFPFVWQVGRFAICCARESVYVRALSRTLMCVASPLAFVAALQVTIDLTIEN